MSPSPLFAKFSARLFAQNQFSVKLGLDRMRRALSHVSRPDSSFDSLVVAGTNGKGTTAGLTAALMTASGLRVGLYTSPHLMNLRERFRIDGEPMSESAVLEVGLPVLQTFAGDLGDDDLQKAGLQRSAALGWPAWDFSEGPLTFFELTTLMAFLLFERAEVDVAVVEIGLGGRLDAVNAVEPVLTAITAIGLDHQVYLGEALDAIAREKGATMRRGHRAFMSRQPHSEAAVALEDTASAIGAELSVAPPVDATLPTWLSDDFEANVELACALAGEYVEGGLSTAARDRTVATFRWPGRRDTVEVATPWELRGQYLLDAAHNPAGAGALARYVRKLPAAPSVGVLGIMADKDIAAMAMALAPSCSTWIATAADTPRAAAPGEIADALVEAGASDVRLASSLREALVAARCKTDGPVLVCGSVYLVGETLERLGFSVQSLHIAC